MAGSPNPDLGGLFDKHVSSEFEVKDADATMETMTGDPTVIHVPVLTGGRGTQELHAFYRDWFIPAWPDDVEVEQVSRTVGSERVVDELIIRFTHTCEMPFWLPGCVSLAQYCWARHKPRLSRISIPHPRTTLMIRSARQAGARVVPR